MVKSTKRIGYIDAMRGMTILLVVYSHLYVMALRARPESWLQETFRLFRMPLFFFISGFIAYTAIDKFTASGYGQRMLKKAKVQLIPTVVFVTLFLIAKGLDFNFLFLSGGALGGYWFTVSLFWMFVAYYTVSLISRLTTPRLFAPLMIGVSALCFYLYCDTDVFVNNDVASLMCLMHACHYLVFFVTGVFFRKFMPQMTAVLHHHYVSALLLAVFVVSAYYNKITPKTDELVYGITQFAAAVSGLLLVVSIFQRHSDFFESDNRICRALRFLGKRTLDIYLLHYFFLPDLSRFSFLTSPSNCAFEFPLALVCVLVIVCMCLLASAVIRNSDFLAHWLFGAKKTTKEIPPVNDSNSDLMQVDPVSVVASEQEHVISNESVPELQHQNEN